MSKPLGEWTVYVHSDDRYISIRHKDQPGDTLLKMPEGLVDRERVSAFVEAAQAAEQRANELQDALDSTWQQSHEQADEAIKWRKRANDLADALRAIVKQFETTDYCEARDLANAARAALDRQEQT